MNREQRRAAERKIKKQITQNDKENIDALVELLQLAYARKSSYTTPIKDGDKVMLKTEQISSRKEFENMSEPYKNFVSSSKNRVFTAHIEHKNLVSFTELDGDEDFLFWDGDLELVEDEGGERDGR